MRRRSRGWIAITEGHSRPVPGVWHTQVLVRQRFRLPVGVSRRGECHTRVVRQVSQAGSRAGAPPPVAAHGYTGRSQLATRDGYYRVHVEAQEGEVAVPVNVEALSIDRDDRLRAFCVTAKVTYGDFLLLTTGAESNLDIQRSIIRGTKAYATLRSDLKRGCILPPIVLAVVVTLSADPQISMEQHRLQQLSGDLATVGSEGVYVIDGLQRTNAIRQTAEELDAEARSEFLTRSLRVEMWLNVPFSAIAYRMLLLNAGQRPMSVKHQVEILSSKLVDDLSGIPKLDIFRVSDTRRRTQPGQFALAKIAQAFQAWLQGQPNLDLRNTVMEELLAESAIEVLGQTVPVGANGANPDGFQRFMDWLVRLDVALGPENISFLGNETVILGLSAAAGAMERNETLAGRLWPALLKLLHEVQAIVGGDPAALRTFDALRQGIDSSKVNVGLATREMVFNAFKEYIRGAGETSMHECWQIGAARF